MSASRPFLGEILLKSGVIFESQLLMALNEQKCTNFRFGEILIKNGWASEEEVARALSEQLDIPDIFLDEAKPDQSALDLVPKSMAERLGVLPVSLKNNGTLVVATAEPTDILAIDELKFYTNLNIEVKIATIAEISKNTNRFYTIQQNMDEPPSINLTNVLIGGILLNAGVINENQIKCVLEEQKKSNMRFGDILLSKGWITERDLAEGLSVQLGVPVVSAEDIKPAPWVLKKFPRSVAERLKMLPLGMTSEGRIKVAAAEPMDIVSIDEIKRICGGEVQICVAVPSELSVMTSRFYDSLQKEMDYFMGTFTATLVGQMISDAELLTPSKAREAALSMKKQKLKDEDLVSFLLNEGYVQEDELMKCLSSQSRIPIVDLSFYEPDLDALAKMPQSIAEKYGVLPLTFLEKGQLLLGVVEPPEAVTREKLEMITGQKHEYRMVNRSSLAEKMPLFYKRVGKDKNQKIFKD